jgi:hypothetical protein
MSTRRLVSDTYDHIWKSEDYSATSGILMEDFSFRGSLGAELVGESASWDYARAVRSELEDH